MGVLAIERAVDVAIKELPKEFCFLCPLSRVLANKPDRVAGDKLGPNLFNTTLGMVSTFCQLPCMPVIMCLAVPHGGRIIKFPTFSTNRSSMSSSNQGDFCDNH